MAAEAKRTLAAILAAAVLGAAFEAQAQTRDPGPAGADPDCLMRQEGCLTDGSRPPAVVLPDLIVDLFPAGGAGEAPPPDAASAAAAGGSLLPDNPPLPQAAPRGVSRNAAVPRATPRAIAGAFVPDEVLVTVDGDEAAVGALAAEFGLEVRSQRQSLLLGLTVARFGIPDGRPVAVVLAQLAGDGRALSKVPNHIYDLQQAAGMANYAFRNIALPPESASGENVRVAVVDTAVDETHPALKDAIAGMFDAMPDVPVAARDHGTSVAGLIAGTGAFRGIAPGASIYHARAFEGGRSTTDIILAALDWAAGQDVRIINMSFVGPRNDLLEAACTNARGLGLLLVAAAGNNGPNAPWGYPAAYDGVIAVTATDEDDKLMPRANRGPYVFVSAPGVDMLAPIGGGSDLVTGTSFAAAIVSGAIANLLHSRAERSADWVESALAATARDLGASGRDVDFGYGLLNTSAAELAK